MELQSSKRYSYIMRIPFIKGLIILFWGIIALVLFNASPYLFIKAFGILNIVTGVLTLIFTQKFQFLKISKQWLALEAIIELVAGFVFTFLVTSVDVFLNYLSIGIFFIAFLQFIYGYTLLNSGQFNLINILTRFITLFGGIIVGVIIFRGNIPIETAVLIVGVFSVIYGIINIHYSMELKNAVLGELK